MTNSMTLDEIEKLRKKPKTISSEDLWRQLREMQHENLKLKKEKILLLEEHDSLTEKFQTLGSSDSDDKLKKLIKYILNNEDF